MSKASDLVAAINPLWQQLCAELASPATPPVPVAAPIATADALRDAFARGGSYALFPGTYPGNFVASKPITLTGPVDAVLTPVDLSAPTLMVSSSAVQCSGFTVRNGAPEGECVVVGNLAATSVDQQPHDVVLDGLHVEAGPSGGHRGIALHGSALTVRNGRVTGFWRAGQDAQAVWMLNGPGPYTVENNYLEGSGETIMVGGDRINIPNCLPADIVIRGNTCYKPDSWRTPTGPTVKNGIEIKAGRRVLIENNVIDGNWKSGQPGTPILLTVRNQYGDNPWVVVDEVTVRGNVTKRCTDGFGLSILGHDNEHPSGQTLTVLVEDNLFTDSPAGILITNGVTGSLIVRNNRMPGLTAKFLGFTDTTLAAITKSALQFVGNIVRSGEYGITGDGTGGGLAVGTPTLTAYTHDLVFTGNTIELSADRPIPYPTGNTLVPPGKLLALLDPVTFRFRA